MDSQLDSVAQECPSASHDAPLPAWKRAIDLACCIAALPFFALTTLFVASLIALASPGPIFFRQQRIGYRGRPFYLYKFRTMRTGAETVSHQAHFAELVRTNVPMQKLDVRGDKRLIPGGWLLRASGLDELPQVINVLRGEMSIVGPRPCIPYEYDQYSPAQRQRFETAPGLTGLWQVSGKNRTTFDEMIALDLSYVREKSPGLDVKIILLTLPALAGQIAHTRKQKKAVHEKSVSTTNNMDKPESVRSANDRGGPAIQAPNDTSLHLEIHVAS